MINYVIYGKTIIDNIRLITGEMVLGVLGGGGPQGAFGARVWDQSVGILTRSGTDIPNGARGTLEGLGIDLGGWKLYEQHQTPISLMAYDEREYMLTDQEAEKRMKLLMQSVFKLGAEELPIPENYQHPRVIHLITELPHEPMADAALKMKTDGSIYSLEPIIDPHHMSNREEMLAYLPNVDIVTPDWPSASSIAGSDDPLEVLKYWSRLGAGVVAVRHGMHGSYVWDQERDHMWHIPIVKVKTVDPTGCGNSYGGGLCVGWDKHRDAKIAGCCGTVSASFLARIVGVQGVTPELEREAQQVLAALLDQVVEM